MPNPEIRILTESDASAWRDLRSLALSSEPLAFGKSLEEHLQTPVEAIADRFRTRTNDKFTLGAFVAHSSLVGTVTFLRDTELKSRHKGWLLGMFVSKEHRRTGVAKSLMGALIESVRTDSSIEQIHLSVATNQTTARALYRHFGFEPYGIEPHALKVGNVYLDEEFMCLRLQPPVHL